ncbi:hypothetical protein Bbelb_087460 [Branchiostoma belcheri]|nr:hypothetical protein Bbelb_087460 [Branchiostoma belcheri]
MVFVWSGEEARNASWWGLLTPLVLEWVIAMHFCFGEDIDVEPHPTVLFISDNHLSTGREHSCHSLHRLYFLVCRPGEHSLSAVASSGLSRRGGSLTGSGTEY